MKNTFSIQEQVSHLQKTGRKILLSPCETEDSNTAATWTSGRKALLLLLFVLLMRPVLPAVENFSVCYSFDKVLSGQNGRIDPTSPPTVEGLVFSPFVAVPGLDDWKLGANPSAKEVFSFKGWPLASQATGQADQYYEFSVTPEAGRSVKVESISFKVTRSSTGIRHFAVRSSADNYASNLTATFPGQDTVVRVLDGNVFEMADVEKKNLLHQVTLARSSEKALTFRFYGWDAESSAGTFVLDDVTVTGEVSDIAALEAGLDIVGTPHLLMEAWREESWSSSFTFRDSSAHEHTFTQTVQAGRRGVDAALAVYNPSETEKIRLSGLQLNITDTAGRDVSGLFMILCDPLEMVAPRSEAVVRVRLVPRPETVITEAFTLRLGGSFDYEQVGDGTVLRQWLYPFSLTAEPTARCRIDYLVPWQAELPMMVRLSNLSDYASLPITLHGDSNEIAPDSIVTDTIPAHATVQYPFRLKTGLSAVEPLYYHETLSSCQPADTALEEQYRLLQKPSCHLWLRAVSLDGKLGTDTDSDYLCLSNPPAQLSEDVRPDYIFTAGGETVPLSQAGLSLEDWYYGDSLVYCSLHRSASGWHYGTVGLDLPEDSLSVLSVRRMNDGQELPASNYWIEGRQLHLLDQAAADTMRYAVCLDGRWQDVSCLTEIYDSICLNGTYHDYGFELPAQTQAGDFVFCDTLSSVHGLDSLVCLYLNVCPQPDQPEEILGDSLIIRSGNYEYTVRPVPSALFYVWTAFPEDWCLSGEGESVVLNIPYPGNGSISVKAVNRCGESATTTRNLQGSPDGLGDVPAGLFRIYPNPAGSDFSLETEGISGRTRIAVSDMAGRLIYMEEKVIDAADRIFRFSLEGYADGMYIISIVNENMTSSIKMEKK